MKKLLFIFNPVAGKAQIVNRIHYIIEFYTKEGYLVTAFPTGGAYEIREVLKLEMYSSNLIICAGGDGTLNNVISQCMETHCSLPIGYLPVGSTNDFARTLGFNSDFTEVLRQSCSSRERRIDVGKFNDQYFVYVAAFGSLAEVSYSTPQWSKNILGHFAYLLKGIQKVADINSYSLTIEYDGKIREGKFCVGLVMNSLSIGGFKNPVSQDVILDDGLFEVLLVKTPQNLNELQQIIVGLLNQKIFEEKMFIYIQTGHLKIDSDWMEWTLDGEFGGTTQKIEIWNCRKALRIVGTETVKSQFALS